MYGVLFLFLCCASSGAAEEEVAYSFRVPDEWGTLSLEDAHCCPRSVVPKNITSDELGLPDAIGLGVQKGGSSSLSSYLSRHPSYIFSRPKETHFFDKKRPPRRVRDYQRAWGRRGNATSIRYEFTPSYLWIPSAACRVKAILPNLKFLVILRDPAKRAYSEFTMVRTRCRGPRAMCGWKHSHFLQFVHRGIEDMKERECTFDNGAAVKNWNDCFQCLTYSSRFRKVCKYRPYYLDLATKRTCFHFGSQFVSRGLYAAQLAWWFSLFPPQNFLIINSDSFFRDALSEMSRVNKFFGVEQRFEEWMTKSRGMKSNYKIFKDPHKDEALAVLRSFYARPNQELYKLLGEVGLGPFPPFEKPAGSESADLKARNESAGGPVPRLDPIEREEMAYGPAAEPSVTERDVDDLQDRSIKSEALEEEGSPTGIEESHHSGTEEGVQEQTPASNHPKEEEEEEGVQEQTPARNHPKEEESRSTELSVHQLSSSAAIGQNSEDPYLEDKHKEDSEVQQEGTVAEQAEWRPGINADQRPEEEPTPRTVVSGKGITHHRMLDRKEEWSSPSSPGRGLYLLMAVFVLATVIWLLRPARRR